MSGKSKTRDINARGHRYSLDKASPGIPMEMRAPLPGERAIWGVMGPRSSPQIRMGPALNTGPPGVFSSDQQKSEVMLNKFEIE